MLSARMGKRTWVARRAHWQGNSYACNQVLLRTPGSEDLAPIKATIWKVPMDSIFPTTPGIFQASQPKQTQAIKKPSQSKFAQRAVKQANAQVKQASQTSQASNQQNDSNFAGSKQGCQPNQAGWL